MLLLLAVVVVSVFLWRCICQGRWWLLLLWLLLLLLWLLLLLLWLLLLLLLLFLLLLLLLLMWALCLTRTRLCAAPLQRHQRCFLLAKK